jgi:hypothetical protein
MKLYHGKFIIPGLAVFLLLASFPILRGFSGAQPPFQSPPNPKSERCIESGPFMRAHHMRLLKQWRDDVVRAGDRVYVAGDGRRWEKSLTRTCLGCHGQADKNGHSTSAATFCTECHIYVNAKPDCWNCHMENAEFGIRSAE